MYEMRVLSWLSLASVAIIFHAWGICFIAPSLLEERSHATCDHMSLLLGHEDGRRIVPMKI
jgi:hypothetical protein